MIVRSLRAGATLVVVMVACTGGGSGSTEASGSGGALTLDAFAKDYCSLSIPCCTRSGEKNEPEACAIALTLGMDSAAFDAAAGRKCLDGFRGASTTPTFCSDFGGKTVEASCSAVLAPSGTGTKQPGEPCESLAECAPSPDGRTQCFTGRAKRACQVQVRAKEGDACVTTKQIAERYAGISSADVGDLDRVGVCFESDELFCAGSLGEEKKCKKQLPVGAECSTSSSEKSACGGGARCDRKTYKCALPLAIGERCTPGTFSGSIGSDDPCIETAYCDSTTKVCTINVRSGEPCTASVQCGTTNGASCQNGKCSGGINVFSCIH